MITHQQASPAKVAYKKKQANKTEGLKLSASQVKKIKTILNNKNRSLTIKQLAKNYKVSEMTMYRIKSGENWASV
jgi:response regulator of citrate/malate metabolism